MSSLNVTLPVKSSDIVQLEYILQLVVGIFGLTILILGIFGNLVNIIVFIVLGYYKSNPCSLYILSRSIVDFLTLIFGLGTRILSQTFDIDLTRKSSIWCKFRVPIIYVNTLSSYTFICLQSIDIYLVTSLSISLRNKSNIRTSRYLIFIFIIFWIIEEFPYLLYQNLEIVSGINELMCITTNLFYNKYRIYFIYLILTTIIPIIFILYFNILTYRQVSLNLINNQGRLITILTQQMTRMTLFHFSTILIFQAPFAVSQSYFLTIGFSQNPIRKAQEQILQQFFNVLGYGIYSTSFYCYYISSKRFRQQVFNVLSFSQRRANRIQP